MLRNVAAGVALCGVLHSVESAPRLKPRVLAGLQTIVTKYSSVQKFVSCQNASERAAMEVTVKSLQAAYRVHYNFSSIVPTLVLVTVIRSLILRDNRGTEYELLRTKNSNSNHPSSVNTYQHAYYLVYIATTESIALLLHQSIVWLKLSTNYFQ